MINMNKPNIILLVLDAVRADHVSISRNGHSTTPNLDVLADNSTVFENAFSNSNWTGTSHGTLFTGRLPSDTGVHGSNQELPSDCHTLPETLKKAGYRTFGMSAGAHIRSERGYDRGIDRYKETYRISPSQDFFSGVLNDQSFRNQLIFSLTKGPDKKTLFKFDSLKRWISDDNQPFFAFINAKTAHNPYNPPRPHKSLFCTELNRPKYQFIEQIMGDERGEYQSLSGADWGHLKSLSYKFPVISNKFEPTETEWDTIESWYDGAIHYMDQQIGDLISWLRRHNEFEDTCLFITADHGEYFGEHGLEKHYYGLYEPVLHVPLIIHNLNESAKNISEPVTLADLYPTIIEVATGSSPKLPQAVSLCSLDDIASRKYVFAELGAVAPDGIRNHHPNFDDEGYGTPLKLVRNDSYKLIYGQNGHTELYRWKDDPAELTDLSDQHLGITEHLTDLINQNLDELSSEPLSENIEDSDLRKHLENLGYM
jgi:arylsulfatase A-like enzyme